MRLCVSRNMGEANKGRRGKEMENLSLQGDKFPRDLLQRFMSSSSTQEQPQQAETQEDSEDIELNLGLSLGGRFGVDKNAKKLTRSSSVVGTMPLVREDKAPAPPPVAYPALTRTSSLPAETEEEWRKRKELQTLRRMAAKRRRSEKQRNSKAEREGGGGGLEEERREIGDKQNQFVGCNRFGSTGSSSPVGLPSWATSTRQLVLGDVLAKGKPSSQGSVDSQGGSSSGMSEMESKPFQGSSSGGEARSPASNQSLQERSNQEALGSSGTKAAEEVIRTTKSQVDDASKRPDPAPNRGQEIGTNSMEDMPFVFTKGDGPNGRRIEGILYKYGKRQEVRIMCVCHGIFLSPAEFVKHAGGGDVDNPLRHIVVNPNSTPFL